MAQFLADFTRLVESAEPLDLAAAALTFAREEYPAIRIPAYVARLDELAAQAAPRIAAQQDPERIVRELGRFLFQEKGFLGNQDEYYDPRNSFLNLVIDRGLGIPISLSAVTLEIGRRLFLPLHGVGFPGHFLVKYAAEGAEILFDPFTGGQILTRRECQERLDQVYGGTLRLEESHLAATPTREILARMLQNLKAIYGRGTDHARTLWVLDYLLVARPDDPRELRVRGELRYRMGQYPGAEHDLVRALSRWPADDPTRAELEALLGTVRKMRRKMN